jgi:hypothetical protein
MNTINFNLVDITNNPIIGSLVTLRIYSTTGSVANFPIPVISDTNGTASYSNVNAGIYSLKYTNANFGTVNYINYEPTEVYLNIPTITGSVNGFDYITSSISLPIISGSNITNATAEQLESDISSMCNLFKNELGDLMQQEQGICIIAEEITEKLMTGFNNIIGPKLMLVFLGEDKYGDEATAEMTGWVTRNFDCVVHRGKLMTSQRNSALTKVIGNVRSFYSLVEKIRDTIRCVELPMRVCQNPVIVNNIRPGNNEGWLMDSYIINFSVLVNIGRVQFDSPSLVGNSPFVNTDGINGWSPNSTP